MPNKQRHEYELKFKVGVDRDTIPAVRRQLQAAGFKPALRCVETDYLPDTAEGACKRSKMLLRFRHVEGATLRELLLTLKIKQSDSGILHFREYETNLYSPDSSIVATINNLLRGQTIPALDESVIQAKTLEQARDAAQALGFTKHRILLSKYRENFSRGEDNATIDYFPDGMGVYVEFESHSAVALRDRVKQAGFNGADGTDTDYGDLLKLHKASLQDQAQRIALFSESEMTDLRSLMKGFYGK